jgi:hypothetical protein
MALSMGLIGGNKMLNKEPQLGPKGRGCESKSLIASKAVGGVLKGPQLQRTVTGMTYTGNVKHWPFLEGLCTRMCGRLTRTQEMSRKEHKGSDGVITTPISTSA